MFLPTLLRSRLLFSLCLQERLRKFFVSLVRFRSLFPERIRAVGNASKKNTHKVTRGMCQVQETENQGVFKVPVPFPFPSLDCLACRYWVVGGRVSGLKLKVSPGVGVVGGNVDLR